MTISPSVRRFLTECAGNRRVTTEGLRPGGLWGMIAHVLQWLAGCSFHLTAHAPQRGVCYAAVFGCYLNNAGRR